jgi:hypothetical protein
VNMQSGLCLSPVYPNSGNVDVRMAPCDSTIDQRWYRYSTNDDTYKIIKNKATNKCLDVANYDGYGLIGTYNCEGTNDQIFQHSFMFD